MENLIKNITENIKLRKDTLTQINKKNGGNVDNYSRMELKRCAMIIKQIKKRETNIIELKRGFMKRV